MTDAARRRTAGLRLGVLASSVCLALVGCTTPPIANEPEPKPLRGPFVYIDPIERYADARLSIMPLQEKVASLFMLHQAGTDASSLESFASGTGAGGLILMRDNIPEPESRLAGITAGLSAEPGLPLLVAIDQEGGTVRRLLSDSWDSARALRGLPPEAARAAFASRSALLADLGVSVNFGIVADVTGDTGSFIYRRSLGSTAADAAARVEEAVAGELGSVYSTLKHFPGHGVAPGDSHSSIPSTGMGYDQWLSDHAPPFQAGIDAGAGFVMFGHLRFDAIDPVPASLSPVWHEILRDDLGFEGIIITDDMLMLERSGDPALSNRSENAIRALAAGATMLLYVGGIDAKAVATDIVAAVEAGRITEQQVDDAAHALLMLRRELSGQTGPFVHCFEECRDMLR